MTDWRDSAACKGSDVGIFYTLRGESQVEARAICASCPVADECLEHALATGEKFGLWGGHSEKQRRTLRRQRNRLRHAA